MNRIIKINDSEIRGKYLRLPDLAQKEKDVVVVRNEEFLFIFTVSEWMSFFREMKEVYAGKKRRIVERSFSRRSRKVRIKKDGRILIPAEFRKD